MTAEVTDYETRLVAVPETLCLPEESEPEWKYGLFQRERKKNNALQKQKLWAYIRHLKKTGAIA
jgi:hypothetical protein